MIKNWFIMKKKEIILKITLYTAIEKVIAEQKEITTLLSNLFTVLKDVPLNELKDEFLEKLAEIIHDQAEAERNGETSIKGD
ncbi:hypothetical protein [Enterocloster bolteae]|uniref:Uncharacterized protein n=1 Tax=Enterocloster bolteae 90B8 TaxID=997897 RepID=R0AP30_9FIRM|nr:hypothetical protein [Enterocloster bolteae]ENZ38143.1 hypothetical protein HMPREF1097_02729 [Enterocloster bolteae 90B8]